MLTPRQTVSLGFLLLVASPISSCIFVAGHHRLDKDGSWHIDTDDGSEVKADDKSDKPANATAATAKKDEAAEKAAKLELAQLENQIDALEVKLKLSEANQARERALKEADWADKALEHFKSVELPNKVADAKIDLERAAFGIELQQDELNELLAMFKNEEFAASTKELVVKRDQHNLEFAKREFALQQAKFDSLQNIELPKALFEKEQESKKAHEELAKADVELEKANLEAKASALKAKQKIDELQKSDAKPEAKG